VNSGTSQAVRMGMPGFDLQTEVTNIVDK
jgi:hypothetical protein